MRSTCRLGTTGDFSATGYVVDQQRAVRGATVPQNVTLVSWGRELEVGLRLLLAQERQLQAIHSPAELAKGIPPADVVVVDVPAQDRRAVCEQVRRHHRGRLLVLLDRGDNSHDLPPHPNQTLLTRPFFVYELSAALSGSGPTQPTPDPANRPPPVLPVLPRMTLARRANSRLGSGRSLVTHAVAGLLRSWRERRLVRLSAISLCAAVLVMVALVLITHGAGCEPACNELTGAELTAPSSTTVATAGQYATASSVGTVGPTTTDPSVDPTTDGRSRVDAATSSRPEIARTTAASSATPRPTSPPDPTQPPPTAAPTTAPTTTRPKPSTTTTTTTTRPWPPDH
jgi:hypothetical protein